MLAKFNETMEPLYVLLKEIEDIRLTPDLLDPDIDSRIEQNQVYDGTFATGKWADKKKGSMPYGLLSGDNKNFNVKIEDSSSDAQAQNQTKKEAPVWMMESTISGASNFDKNRASNVTNGMSKPIIDTLDLPMNEEFSSEKAKEVLETLLNWEKPNELKWHQISKFFGFVSDMDVPVDSDPSQEPPPPVDMNEIDNIDFFQSLPMVRVNNCLVPLSKVDDDCILMMSEMEKQEYVNIAQQIYAAMFDI